MTDLVGVAITVSSTFAGAAVAAVGVSWRLRGWLGDQFTSTRTAFSDAIKAHEELDQDRHEQNLERFADIRVALARSGVKNGEGHFGGGSSGGPSSHDARR